MYQLIRRRSFVTFRTLDITLCILVVANFRLGICINDMSMGSCCYGCEHRPVLLWLWSELTGELMCQWKYIYYDTYDSLLTKTSNLIFQQRKIWSKYP